MALLNTAIQAALGESAKLDHAMILRAVEDQVSESDRLDWKGGPYAGEDAAAEFAKDVAALANTRVDLVRTDDRPFAISTPGRLGNGWLTDPEQPQWSRDVRRFVPVDITLDSVASPHERRWAAHAIAEDVLSQFGMTPQDIGWQSPVLH
ncbi:MAG: hypothetical protein ACRCYU_10940 [Nocardioides sp.]